MLSIERTGQTDLQIHALGLSSITNQSTNGIVGSPYYIEVTHITINSCFSILIVHLSYLITAMNKGKQNTQVKAYMLVCSSKDTFGITFSLQQMRN